MNRQWVGCTIAVCERHPASACTPWRAWEWPLAGSLLWNAIWWTWRSTSQTTTGLQTRCSSTTYWWRHCRRISMSDTNCCRCWHRPCCHLMTHRKLWVTLDQEVITTEGTDLCSCMNSLTYLKTHVKWLFCNYLYLLNTHADGSRGSIAISCVCMCVCPHDNSKMNFPQNVQTWYREWPSDVHVTDGMVLGSKVKVRVAKTYFSRSSGRSDWVCTLFIYCMTLSFCVALGAGTPVYSLVPTGMSVFWRLWTFCDLMDPPILSSSNSTVVVVFVKIFVSDLFVLQRLNLKQKHKSAIYFHWTVV